MNSNNKKIPEWIKYFGTFILILAFYGIGFYWTVNNSIANLKEEITELKEIVKASELSVTEYRLNKQEEEIKLLKQKVENLQIGIGNLTQ